MKTHHLKTWPTQFRAIKAGQKTFELRTNDRDFREGDTLVLEEWNPCQGDGAYTGDTLTFKAGWILYGGQGEFGCPSIPADQCIVSLADACQPTLSEDVIRLVVAARAVAYGDEDHGEGIRALDQACEAFASRVPWQDEPVSEAVERG